MDNKNDIITQFKAEHEYVMLSLSVQGQELGIYTPVDFYRALFAFADEVSAVVRLAGTTRRGVALYDDYWHAACALMPDHIARTDLIHALLFAFITAHGHDVQVTRQWSTRRGTIFGRLIDDCTLASELVNELKREDWLNIETVQALIIRGDLFDTSNTKKTFS